MAGKRSKSGTPREFEHGPIPVPRVPPSEQEPGFLEDLRARGEVLPVGEDWSGTPESLPPGVNWVVYPNGDLRRVRI
jgi:hypothetical protein